MDVREPLSHGFRQSGPIEVCENSPVGAAPLNLFTHSVKDDFNVIAKTLFECISILGEVIGDSFSCPPHPLE